MSSQAVLDPYTTKAVNNTSSNLTLQDKINGVQEVIKKVGCGMLTTKGLDGHLHSRAMAPAGPVSGSQLTLLFIANDASGKFNEINNDDRVNVSFYDNTTSDWASFAGVAKVTKDKGLIDKHWSKVLSAWFGDLKDGVHKGDKNDPRVTIIEVIPDEIRYWYTKSTAISRGAQIVGAVVTGAIAAPGELRTINSDEIALSRDMNSSK